MCIHVFSVVPPRGYIWCWTFGNTFFFNLLHRRLTRVYILYTLKIICAQNCWNFRIIIILSQSPIVFTSRKVSCLFFNFVENFHILFKFITQGEEITSNGSLPEGKDAMSIFNSAPKSGQDLNEQHEHVRVPESWIQRSDLLHVF